MKLIKSMNYKELFLECKKHNLRYISTGWSRIHPFASTYEIPSQITKIKHHNEANIILEFGDDLNRHISIACKCLDFKNSTIYRFKAAEIKSKDELEDPKISFKTGDLIIQTVEIFEPTTGLYSIKEGESLDEIDEDLYFGNALLFSFSNGSQLEFYGTEGDDQHKPSIYSKFINSDEKEIYNLKRGKNWQLKHKI